VVHGVRQSAADGYLTPSCTGRTSTWSRVRTPAGWCCTGAAAGASSTRWKVSRTRPRLTGGRARGGARSARRSSCCFPGIGPAAQLREVGVDVVADRPAVGENLHEHPQAGVAYSAPGPVRVAQFARRPHVRVRSDPAGPGRSADALHEQPGRIPLEAGAG
jgi:choline dehydrogenase